jgi:hypothetical protein
MSSRIDAVRSSKAKRQTTEHTIEQTIEHTIEQTIEPTIEQTVDKQLNKQFSFGPFEVTALYLRESSWSRNWPLKTISGLLRHPLQLQVEVTNAQLIRN